MAFYFDIDVAPDPGSGGYKIYCSNITRTWETIKTSQDVQKLVEQLPMDNSAKKGFIPKIQDTSSGNQVNIFLNQLSSTATCLKSNALQEFLDVPEEVRNGIKWVRDKPFGEKIKGGMVTLYSQKVRRSQAKRYLILYKDPKVGGSLVMYLKEPNEKARHINSLKIANATIIKAVTTLDNGFQINSGKRSWLVSAANSNDFAEWLREINEILRECGAQLIKLPKELQNQNQSFRPVRPSKSYRYENINNNEPIPLTTFTDNQNIDDMEPEELEKANNELETRRDQLLDTLVELEDNIKDIEKYLNEWRHGKKEMNEKFEKEVQQEKAKITKIYDVEKENLKAYLERKKRLLRSKGNIKNTGTKKKKKDKKDKKDLSEYKEEDGDENFEQTVQIDLEKRLIMKNTPDERKDLRFIHKHLYKHTYKHNHKHIHIHVDNDMMESNPDKKFEEESFKDVHTVEHTITHTNTQTQVKPGIFG